MKYSFCVILAFLHFIAFSQENNNKSDSTFQSIKDVISPASPQNPITHIPNSVNSLTDFIALHKRANSLPGQKNPTAIQQEQMNGFVNQCKQTDVTSFDYNLSAFMTSNYNIEKKELLEKAKSIQPTNYNVLIQSVGVNYILSENQTLIADLNALVKQNSWTIDELAYAKEVLASVPVNGLLITHGTNDSYPILYQQFVNNYRKDIRVIPMQLLQSEQYKNRLSEVGLKLPSSQLINFDYLKEFCSLNDNESIFLSLTIPTNYFSAINHHLYPIGLTFNYSKIAVQNSEQNSALWNKQLKSALNKLKEPTGKELSANYLPMLVNLYHYYLSTNNNSQLIEIKNSIKIIGRNINNDKLLKELGLSE